MSNVINKDDPLASWLEEIEEMPANEEGFREEMAKSYEVVKKLLPFMAKRGIPVTPNNFHLFFDYIIFSNPEINKIINKLLDKGVKFGSQVSDNLYNFFYCGEGATLTANAIKAADTFISISDSMAENIKNAKSQNDHFHEVLSSASRQMSDIDRPEELQPCLANLMAETEQTLIAADVFSCRIREANNTIITLKEELKLQTNLANVDELTQLANRHRLNNEAPRLIREAMEQGQPLSATLFDIDWFKVVNDTWGHDQGDKVLKACADIIRRAARSTDLAVRFGGEEFLLLCANLDLDTAVKVADRVRQSIADTKIELPGQALSVTISGGVAEYRTGEDLADLIARADAALYQAKATGRNRVQAAPQ